MGQQGSYHEFYYNNLLDTVIATNKTIMTAQRAVDTHSNEAINAYTIPVVESAAEG